MRRDRGFEYFTLDDPPLPNSWAEAIRPVNDDLVHTLPSLFVPSNLMWVWRPLGQWLAIGITAREGRSTEFPEFLIGNDYMNNATVDVATKQVAELVQDQLAGDHLDWPTVGASSLVADLSEGRAVWRVRSTGSVYCPIGSLPDC